MLIGGITAVVNGIALPLFSLVFGEMTDSFSPTTTADETVDNAGQ